MVKQYWFLRPITIFIFSLLALGTSLYLYIYSYLKVNDAFSSFVKKHNFPENQFVESETWVMVLVMSILVTIIILGMVLIFVYYQKMIELYRMQQNFINGFTHELKTPIASIRLYLDTFLKHELPRDEEIKYLSYMKKDTDRLSDNVNLILNLAKIEDRKYKTNFESINLNHYFSELIEKANHSFEGLIINLKIDDDIKLKVDKNLFEVLVMNLISNAYRYNHSEQKKLEIKISKVNTYVELEFTDNGAGITKEDQKNIFKKFYQVGKSTKGSGLGLYMAKHVVKIHKGDITISSPGPDLGSTFKITIPEGLA